MNEFKGETLSWQIVNGAIELALHRDPCNEIGSLDPGRIGEDLRRPCRCWRAKLML
jgi:hypothetical protein